MLSLSIINGSVSRKDPPIFYRHDSGGIKAGQAPDYGDHYYQSFLCDPLQKIHNLYTGI